MRATFGMHFPFSVINWYLVKEKSQLWFKNGEDSIFMFQISKDIQKIIITDKGAVCYRRFRKNSATTSYQKFSHIFANRVKIMHQYTKLFLSIPFEYDFIFYVSRVFASLKVILKAFYTLVKKTIKDHNK
ncbi:MAG: hypothetical protein HDR51_04920 [Treponema sp.]|nr:hypothetical protein [Treponema sp.]